MIDRALFLAEVFQRNALRRAALLPPLDVRAEYDRAVAIAIDREVRALAQRPEHRAALDRIVEEVRAEMLTKHGIKGESYGGRIAIGHRVAERSMAYLRAVYGAEAKPLPARHPIRYGGGCR